MIGNRIAFGDDPVPKLVCLSRVSAQEKRGAEVGQDGLVSRLCIMGQDEVLFSEQVILLFQIPAPKTRLLTRVCRPVLDHRRQERSRLQLLLRLCRQIQPATILLCELIPIIANQLLLSIRRLFHKLADRLNLQRRSKIALAAIVELAQGQTCFRVARKLPDSGQRRTFNCDVDQFLVFLVQQESDELELMRS